MERIKWLRGSVAVAVVLALGGVASASSFDFPPEAYAPTWYTSFPYQRNIDWTFETDPEGGPSANGAPGADYEGWLDPVLKLSDYVELTGSVGWMSAFDDPGVNSATGVVGIDNRAGSETLTGSIVFHIDNVDTPWIKHFWLEYEWLAGSVGGAGIYLTLGPLTPSPGSNVTDYQAGAPVGTTAWSWWEIEPNPVWEELTLGFMAQPGAYLFLDQVHVATECEVPEPVTIALLVAGLAGLVGVGGRRKGRPGEES